MLYNNASQHVSQSYMIAFRAASKQLVGSDKLNNSLNLKEPIRDFSLMQLDFISCYIGASQTEERMSLTGLGSSAGHSKRLQRKRKLTIGKRNHGIQVFSFGSMVQATDNFSSSNKIGRGGYGIVYKVVENF